MHTLIFLHGLLGSNQDWQKVIEKLPHFRCLSLDLPLHAQSQQYHVENFEQTCRYLATQIQQHIGNSPYFLVGYSLGGRLALYYSLQFQQTKGNLQGIILEGANIGLSNEADRLARWQNDCFWAQRFAQEPIQQVLNDWYQQPVFAHLNTSERMALIEKRATNQGVAIAQMLRATSLAKQPDFRTKLRTTRLPIYYLCGEKDQKFRTIAEQEHLNLRLIPQAGHNAHLENPLAFANAIQAIFDIIPA